MFAEGSLPERHTLALEKRYIFGEVFAEGSLPERHTLVFRDFPGQKIGQGQKLVKKVKILKVLRIGLPIVESLSGLQESIFSLFRGPQLNSLEKTKMIEFY